MAAIGSNCIQMRRVMQRETLQGQQNFREILQYRTKDVVASVLGLIPLASSWSPWKSLELEDMIYLDENGNEL